MCSASFWRHRARHSARSLFDLFDMSLAKTEGGFLCRACAYRMCSAPLVVSESRQTDNRVSVTFNFFPGGSRQALCTPKASHAVMARRRACSHWGWRSSDRRCGLHSLYTAVFARLCVVYMCKGAFIQSLAMHSNYGRRSPRFVRVISSTKRRSQGAHPLRHALVSSSDDSAQMTSKRSFPDSAVAIPTVLPPLPHVHTLSFMSERIVNLTQRTQAIGCVLALDEEVVESSKELRALPCHLCLERLQGLVDGSQSVSVWRPAHQRSLRTRSGIACLQA